jgi:hypothetical protein
MSKTVGIQLAPNGLRLCAGEQITNLCDGFVSSTVTACCENVDLGNVFPTVLVFLGS